MAHLPYLPILCPSSIKISDRRIQYPGHILRHPDCPQSHIILARLALAWVLITCDPKKLYRLKVSYTKTRLGSLCWRKQRRHTITALVPNYNRNMKNDHIFFSQAIFGSPVALHVCSCHPEGWVSCLDGVCFIFGATCFHGSLSSATGRKVVLCK